MHAPASDPSGDGCSASAGVRWTICSTGSRARRAIWWAWRPSSKPSGSTWSSRTGRSTRSIPAGRLLFHMLAAIAEFERDLIRERVIAGIRWARAQGRHVGRPAKFRVEPATARALLEDGVSLRAAARRLGVHPSAVRRAFARVGA